MAQRTDESYRLEVQALLHDLHGVVWYTHNQTSKKGKHTGFEYRLFRKGMGLIAKRQTIQGVVAFLKKQFPDENQRGPDQRFQKHSRDPQD